MNGRNKGGGIVPSPFKNAPPERFFSAFDSPFYIFTKSNSTPIGVLLLFGGDEGNRTPVRKSLDTAFSECIPSFRFPLDPRRRTALDLG